MAPLISVFAFTQLMAFNKRKKLEKLFNEHKPSQKLNSIEIRFVLKYVLHKLPYS